MQLSKPNLFPHVVKEKAAAGKIFGYVASLDGAPEEVSYQRLNNAVDRAARFIEKNMPPDEKVFAWLGKMDFRYTVWMVAASKTGRIVGKLSRLSYTAFLIYPTRQHSHRSKMHPRQMSTCSLRWEQRRLSTVLIQKSR
jgi:hypothetical protein